MDLIERYREDRIHEAREEVDSKAEWLKWFYTNIREWDAKLAHLKKWSAYIPSLQPHYQVTLGEYQVRDREAELTNARGIRALRREQAYQNATREQLQKEMQRGISIGGAAYEFL